MLATDQSPESIPGSAGNIDGFYSTMCRQPAVESLTQLRERSVYQAIEVRVSNEIHWQVNI